MEIRDAWLRHLSIDMALSSVLGSPILCRDPVNDEVSLLSGALLVLHRIGASIREKGVSLLMPLSSRCPSDVSSRPVKAFSMSASRSSTRDLKSLHLVFSLRVSCRVSGGAVGREG